MNITTWSQDIEALRITTRARRSATSVFEQDRYRLRAGSQWRTLWNKVLSVAREREYPHEIWAVIYFVHQATQALQGLQPLEVEVHSARHVEAKGSLGAGSLEARLIHWQAERFVFELTLDYHCPTRGQESASEKRPSFVVEFAPDYALALHHLDRNNPRLYNYARATEFPTNLIYPEWLQLRLAMQRSLEEYRACTR